MIQKLFDGTLKPDQIEPQYYFAVAQKLEEAVKKGMGLQGKLDASKPQTKLFEHLKNNVYAFSAAKSLTQLKEFNRALIDENGDRVSLGRFKQRIFPFEQQFNRVYLQAEYNNAVASAQMANKWQNLQKFDMLEYRTVGDNRVRDSHERLDGLRLPPSDPLWSKIYPPNGWNCRCTVIPAHGKSQDKRELADSFSKSKQLTPYFKKNVGTEKIIYKDDHPYFIRSKHDKDGRQFMAEENYAMRPVSKIMQSKDLPVMEIPADKETAKEAWESLTKKVKTVDGLEWELNDQWKHVVDDHPKEERWKYIDKVSDVLQDADEVWSVKVDKKIYKRYIKYYQSKPIVVSFDVDNPEKWTLYDAKEDENYQNLRNNTRRGILIHRK